VPRQRRVSPPYNRRSHQHFAVTPALDPSLTRGGMYDTIKPRARQSPLFMLLVLQSLAKDFQPEQRHKMPSCAAKGLERSASNSGTPLTMRGRGGLHITSGHHAA
jgi:hypothetical protein